MKFQYKIANWWPFIFLFFAISIASVLGPSFSLIFPTTFLDSFGLLLCCGFLFTDSPRSVQFASLFPPRSRPLTSQVTSGSLSWFFGAEYFQRAPLFQGIDLPYFFDPSSSQNTVGLLLLIATVFWILLFTDFSHLSMQFASIVPSIPVYLKRVVGDSGEGRFLLLYMI